MTTVAAPAPGITTSAGPEIDDAAVGSRRPATIVAAASDVGVRTTR
jgi:hypothetical protein